MLSYSLLLSFLLLDGFCSAINVVCTSNGTIGTAVSTVKYEDLVFHKRTVNLSQPLSVSFQIAPISDPTSVTLSWLFNGQKLVVTSISGDSQATTYNIYSTQLFDKTMSKLDVSLHLTSKHFLAGDYSLIVGFGKSVTIANCFVFSAPILPLFTKPKRVLEGDTMRLSCRVSGYPTPDKVSWSFARIPVNQMDDDGILFASLQNLVTLPMNGTHYSLETSSGDTINDTLRFTQLQSNDNGLYACNVSSVGEYDFTVILVNVKDRWAAMQPFICIVTEVLLLVTAIMLYERHQMRSKQSATSIKNGTGANGQHSMKSQSIPAKNLNVPVNPPDNAEEIVTHKNSEIGTNKN